MSDPSRDLSRWVDHIAHRTSKDEQIYVADWLLQPVVCRPSLIAYINQLWERRHFIMADARAKAFGNSRNMILGHLWLILAPILDAAVYGIIFGLLMGTGQGVDNFVGYLVIGVTFFGFTTSAVNGSAGMIKGSGAIIKAFAFPRASLVISFAIRNFINSIPTIITMIVVLAFWPPGLVVSHAWIYVLVVVILQFTFNLGLSFLVARLSHIMPDIRILIQYATRFWFYLSGVFFSIERFANFPVIKGIMEANPAYQILYLVRSCLLYGTTPSLSVWVSLSIWASLLFIGGFLFFWRGELSYGKE